jgi:L-galactose dehydrogenase
MTMEVPRRTLPLDNANLPKDTPIIGLGCSSFSHFFWSEEELKEAGGASQWTPETMIRSHAHVQEWIQTIHYAINECAITLLDTAPWYGHGTSEVVLGWALDELFEKTPRASLTINTKVGRYEDDVTKQFDFGFYATMQSVERSLKRMKCDYINVLQLHDPEYAPTLEVLLDETIPALIECRKKGWCKALGMTGYPLEVQHQVLEATMKKYGEPVFDQALTYCHYNLHDSSLFDRPITGDNNKSYADFVADNKIVLMAAAPLSMGLLTHAGPPEWHPASDALKEACKNAASICEKEEHVNISALAIMVALANPKITCTLLGMRNVAQVKLAAETAARFSKVPASTTEPEDILKQVLSESEYKTWQVLTDKENGPFAKVWTDGTFRWDGSKDGAEFWKQVEGAKSESWQCPPR